jgi:hypothetical protein
MRQYTKQLLEMIESGLISESTVVNACLSYMSEEDVKDMMECNEFIEDDSDEE